MSSKVIRLADRIQQKWAKRVNEQSDAGEALSGRKHHVTCKCPRCGACHDAAMHWTGRGTPRLFCPSCRSRISGLGAGILLPVSNTMVSNMRRGVHQGQE